jgi:D-lactate dehydrogenase
MSLLLALSRKLFPSVKRVKEGSFNYEGLRGFDLKGKTAGVIGTGNIGKHVLRMLKGFDMHVLAFDAFPNKALQKELGFAYTTLEKLLASSDVITLHVPLFKETTHLINKKNIKKIKKGAYIINTARGGLIESEALLWGLETGHIAGAGLDVLEEEEMLQHPEHVVLKHYSDEEIKLGLISNMLIDHPDVIITPHNAFNSMEALQRIMDTTIANVKAFAAGKTQNDVTAPKPKRT